MTDEKMNQLLQETLSSEMPGEQLNRNIKRKMEEMGMKKHFSMKKAMIMAAVCCLLVGTVSIASSGVVSYIVSSEGADVFTEFEQLEQAEQRAGFQVRAKENFDNGYLFQEVNVSETKDMDENDNVLSTYREIGFIYEKSGEKVYIHTLSSENAQQDMERKPDNGIEIGGINVGYYVDTYKFVPTDYVLTAEDEANMQRDDYFISSGADEVSEARVSYVVWYQDDIRYSIMVYREMPAAELFGMAAELISTEK